MPLRLHIPHSLLLASWKLARCVLGKFNIPLRKRFIGRIYIYTYTYIHRTEVAGVNISYVHRYVLVHIQHKADLIITWYCMLHFFMYDLYPHLINKFYIYSYIPFALNIHIFIPTHDFCPPRKSRQSFIWLKGLSYIIIFLKKKGSSSATQKTKICFTQPSNN